MESKYYRVGVQISTGKTHITEIAVGAHDYRNIKRGWEGKGCMLGGEIYTLVYYEIKITKCHDLVAGHKETTYEFIA